MKNILISGLNAEEVSLTVQNALLNHFRDMSIAGRPGGIAIAFVPWRKRSRHPGRNGLDDELGTDRHPRRRLLGAPAVRSPRCAIP